MKPLLTAFVLAGPTAVGKTDVAHVLARDYTCDILSADSMLVYRGMEIGTAKPTPDQRLEVNYWGVDVVTPYREFSAGDYLRHARICFATQTRPSPLIVVGGTGLYIKALTEGLDEVSGADEGFRRRVGAWSVERLREELRRVDPGRLARLSDPANPRRLIRALELSAAGTVFRSLGNHGKQCPIVGIRMEKKALDARIRARVEAMFARGLVEEARKIREAGPMSRTAMQAIGYTEAYDLLDGRCIEAQAVERIVIRTRQLAKRQMTWFRNQATVLWVDVEPGMAAADVARKVDLLWKEHGPATLHV
ncbi:MAG: tRNA (adenosine(37)-N6)-dimethylallyltransferase MiaA [bacterium]